LRGKLSSAFLPANHCLNYCDRYISDEKATADAHDSDGYFKTGDIARRRGSYYFILGRASLDIIKSGGYKISALDIERDILSLPYTHEVMVVGVADEEYGQRVAAAISLRTDQAKRSLHIDELRKDLRGLLTGYKLPTLLRVVDGELPKNVSGKVLKKVLGPQLFPANYHIVPEVQIWKRKQEAARL
jgi:malonyl-CoA/methylmalonyl-CoA synthetase